MAATALLYKHVLLLNARLADFLSKKKPAPCSHPSEPERSLALGTMSSSPDESLIATLHERLLRTSSTLKRETVIAAVALARDEDNTLTVAKACDDAGVPYGSRSRAAKLSKRIQNENLLVECAPRAPSPPPPSNPTSWSERYPDLEVPCCPDCGTDCELTVLNVGSACSVCSCEILPNLNVNWMAHCSDKSWHLGERSPSWCLRECYLLCHTCTSAGAQLEWAAPASDWIALLNSPGAPELAQYPSVPSVLDEDRPEFWDKLIVYSIFDMTIDDEYDPRGIAGSLHLPVSELRDIDDQTYLLTQDDWIASNAPNIWQLTLGDFEVSADGTQVTRDVEALLKLTSLDERAMYVSWQDNKGEHADAFATSGCLAHYEVRDEITYDFPPTDAECREDPLARSRHLARMRQREKSVIVSLDSSAAEALRAARRQRKQEQRDTVERVVDQLIDRLERDEARCPWSYPAHESGLVGSWSCPGCSTAVPVQQGTGGSLSLGCDVSRCARVQFRRRCMESLSDEFLSAQMHQRWCNHIGAKQFGEFRGPYKGGRYVRLEKQYDALEMQEEELRALPDYHASFGSAEDIAGMRNDFLANWDGVIHPEGYFTNVERRSQASLALAGREYLGSHSGSFDSFGPIFEVGRAVCARSGCDGCCYCLHLGLFDRLPPPPQHVHIQRWHARSCLVDQWSNESEIRRVVTNALANYARGAAVNCAGVDPIPEYLIDRHMDPLANGDFIRISGSVRRLVDTDELAEWASAFSRYSTVFQVLASDSDSSNDPSPSEEKALITHTAHARKAAREWGCTVRERSRLDVQVRFDAHRGCGTRIMPGWPTTRSAPVLGDIMYCQPNAQGGAPGIGVVINVCQRHGQGVGHAGLVCTGTVHMDFWDRGARSFSTRLDCDLSDFVLLPPCCGRGANCPHLLGLPEGERQYPNGDALQLSDLSPIPGAFRAKLDAYPCTRAQRQELVGSYWRLLDPDRKQQRKQKSEAQMTGEVSCGSNTDESAALHRSADADDYYAGCSAPSMLQNDSASESSDDEVDIHYHSGWDSDDPMYELFVSNQVMAPSDQWSDDSDR